MNLFKVLEFKDSESSEKYAHPVKTENGYEWGSSSMPLLMTIDASIAKLRRLYIGLDFDIVKLVPKKLIDIDTVNT